MIKEDYVSFEVAKLLKEKGFNVSTNAFYNPKKSYILKFDPCLIDRNAGIYVSAPTHQRAMKWLREVHHIMINPYALSLGFYFEIFDLTSRDITGCKTLYKVGIPNKEAVLSTYEEAVEAALKYVLKNLI